MVLFALLLENRMDASKDTSFLPGLDFVFECLNVKVVSRQFPIKLSFSATVHRQKGQKQQRMILNFKRKLSSTGQAYD